MLYVDDRRRGLHGIGRFARESVAHLATPYRSLGARGNPARPLDVINRFFFIVWGSYVIYTPGFNAGLTRARQVVTVHDLIHLSSSEERSRAKVLYYERVDRPTVLRAGVVVTVSPTSATAIAEWLGDERVRVVDVGNGCADVFFDPPAAEPVQDSPPHQLQLLWVGSMKPHKRPEVAMRLLAALPAATLTMVTNELDAVRALAAAQGVSSDRIEIVPDCTDEQLRSLYGAAPSCRRSPRESVWDWRRSTPTSGRRLCTPCRRLTRARRRAGRSGTHGARSAVASTRCSRARRQSDPVVRSGFDYSARDRFPLTERARAPRFRQRRSDRHPRAPRGPSAHPYGSPS